MEGGEEGEEVGEATEPEANPEKLEAKSNKLKAPKYRVQRFKGLGEMNASELGETTMDQTKRILKQVTIDDAAVADKTFEILMGDEVEPRKLFIQANAKLAELDV